MLEDAALVCDNLAFFVDHQIEFGKAQLQAGADILWLGDCVASSKFIRAEHYRAFAFEPAARVAAPLSEMGGYLIYHSNETSLEYLKLQMQLPVSAVNVGEGVSIADVKQQAPVKKCLMGNFDPIFLRDGRPDQIAAVTDRMICENALGGGYLFNTGEGVLETTPAENMTAMMGAAIALAPDVARLI